ncbi:MAG: M56 family metallopeptidase, partial [Clostridiales bacterium]
MNISYGETLIASSALILMLIVLRLLLRGHISLRLQYGLWLLVALRLLFPFAIGSVDWSVQNVVNTKMVADRMNSFKLPIVTYQPISAQQYAAMTGIAVEQVQKIDLLRAGANPRQISVSNLLGGIWLIGFLAVGCWEIICNSRFALYLKRNRLPLSGVSSNSVPLYVCPGLPSPCLFGLFKPGIYVHEQVGEESMVYILLHELTHKRHGDTWWAVLRGVCVALYWFNPLVWLAAVLAKRDAELACDEGVISCLTDQERIKYGHTLLNMVAKKDGVGQLFTTATTMLSGKRNLKERIVLIAKKPQITMLALILAVLIVLIAVGCTFSGGDTAPEQIAADYAQKLFDNRNPYLGDAPADGALLQVLGIGDAVGEYSMELSTASQPYVLRLVFSEFFHDATVIDEIMGKYALVLLALIDNAEEIQWRYSLYDQSGTNTVSFTLEDAAAVLQQIDVKNYGQSVDQLRQLLDIAQLPLAASASGGADLPQAICLQAGGVFVDHQAAAQAFLDCEVAMCEQYSAEYTILESKISYFEKIEQFDDILDTPITVYALEYRLLPDHPDQIILAGGMSMEGDWLTESSSMGQPLLLFKDNVDGSCIYLGATQTGSVMEEGGDLWCVARSMAYHTISQRQSKLDLAFSVEGLTDTMPTLLITRPGCSFYALADWWSDIRLNKNFLGAWGSNEAKDVVLT